MPLRRSASCRNIFSRDLINDGISESVSGKVRSAASGGTDTGAVEVGTGGGPTDSSTCRLGAGCCGWAHGEGTGW